MQTASSEEKQSVTVNNCTFHESLLIPKIYSKTMNGSILQTSNTLKKRETSQKLKVLMGLYSCIQLAAKLEQRLPTAKEEKPIMQQL